MWSAKRGCAVVAVGFATLFTGACEQASNPVSPEATLVPLAAAVLPSVPASTPYPGSPDPDRAVVCKEASSPAGSYTFSVSASPLLSGDQVASTVTLSPGQCAIVYNRTTASSSVTNVTIAEQIPQGASYQLNHVAVNDPDGPRNLPGPSVTLKVSQFHGAIATYFNEPTGTPGLGSTPYPGSPDPNRAVVCKEASSPAGTYTFSVSASPVLAGDQVASTVTLSPGQCTIVFNRTTSSSTVTNVTIAEQIPQGASYRLDHVAVNDPDGPRNLPGPSVTLKVSQFHGAISTYFNVATATPPPGPPPGTLRVCKSGAVQGTFNLTAQVVGGVASDVITNNIALTAGSCADVFVRTQGGLPPATVTVTETLAANANTFLSGVTVNGVATATVGAAVVVQQDELAGKVVVFLNATATVGASVNYHPITPTPGQVILCKSSTSPPGTFNFALTGAGTIATDQITSNVSLSAGQCKTVFIRSTVEPVPATILVTEQLSAGVTLASVQVITATTNGSVSGAGGVAVNVNGGAPNTGNVLVFVNVGVVIPPPPGPAAGTVRVCKSGTVPGTFNLTAQVVGGVASDVITNNIALTAGSCADVFVRTQGGLPPATVTVTETLAANANTFLSGVTVNGVATATVGAAVVVQQDELVGKVVVFTNATATVGASVTYHPITPTPGQVILCKSSTSPPGTFNFVLTGAGTVGTDQITSNVSLSAGQCKTVFIRSTVEPVPATILVTEQLSAGVTLASVQVITATTNGSVSGAGGVAVNVNGGATNTGNVLVFFNVGVAIP